MKNRERKVCFFIFSIFFFTFFFFMVLRWERWKGRGKKRKRKEKKELMLGEEQRKRKKRDKKKEKWRRKKKRKKKREEESEVKSWGGWIPKCVYLQDCHHNSVSITWKHLKCVFSFHNSSLENQRIEWWKQNLKTNPNKLFLHGSHHFWVMGDGNRVIGDGNTKTKQQTFHISFFL